MNITKKIVVKINITKEMSLRSILQRKCRQDQYYEENVGLSKKWRRSERYKRLSTTICVGQYENITF